MIEDLTLGKAVDFAVETEKLGQHLYSRLARRFKDDPELGGLFATLAADEEHHANHFAGLRERVAKEPLSFDQQQYLRAVSVSEIFAESSLGKNPDKIETREDALEQAFKLEGTTLSYYQALKEIVQDDLIDEMIAEEKKHLLKVMSYMTTGAKVRGLGDSF